MAAVLAGETDRFAVLVERYERPLLRVAESRLGRRDWAEDVVQEALLCAYKWLASYDSRYSFRTWLWTILLNQCHRHYQRRSRTPLVQAFSDHGPAESADRGTGDPPHPDRPGSAELGPSGQLLAKERSEQLQILLTRLPGGQADAIRLRFYGGLKFREIADAMGCSLSSAKKRVRSGLETMSGWLTATDVGPSRREDEDKGPAPRVSGGRR